MKKLLINDKYVVFGGLLCAIFSFLVCAPKSALKKGGPKQAEIYGIVSNINGEPLSNIPLRFEVLTANPELKGFVRIVTDENGKYSLYWDGLSRRNSQRPVYVLHINYARDYLRNDKYEYQLQKCLVNTPTGTGKGIAISSKASTNVSIMLGHHLWVKPSKCNVRSGPSIKSDEIAEIFKATKLILIEEKGEWYKVKIPTNDLNSFPIYDKIGWVYKPLLSESYIPPVSYRERQREEILAQHPKWPRKYVKIINEGRIEKGMSKEMIRAAWGDPVNTVVNDKEKGITKWEFGTLLKKTVIFEDDQVKNWE